MAQWQNENSGVRNSECSFDQIDVCARARQIRHVHGKVGIRHHARECVHNEVRLAPSCKIKREVILRTVERAKEWNALNVVEMKMAKENMRADGVVAEFFEELVSQEADAGASGENQNLVRVRPDLDTGGIASVIHVFSLWRRSRSSITPESDTHRAAVLWFGSISLGQTILQES